MSQLGEKVRLLVIKMVGFDNDKGPLINTRNKDSQIVSKLAQIGNGTESSRFLIVIKSILSAYYSNTT